MIDQELHACLHLTGSQYLDAACMQLTKNVVQCIVDDATQIAAAALTSLEQETLAGIFGSKGNDVDVASIDETVNIWLDAPVKDVLIRC
jgi:ABC-type xylose transport system substrate-binding protein